MQRAGTTSVGGWILCNYSMSDIIWNNNGQREQGRSEGKETIVPGCVLRILYPLSHLTFATTLQHNFITLILQKVEPRLREVEYFT